MCVEYANLMFVSGIQTTGQLVEVRISNCNQMPCLLRKGSTATIEIDYVPGKSIKSLHFAV
jgi:hypothetical protein